MEQGRRASSTSAARATLPVVGDFNGDGIDEIGVYRDGTWYIDTNNNGIIDQGDQVFQLGGPGDKPVVGDWDGDGTPNPASTTTSPPPTWPAAASKSPPRMLRSHQPDAPARAALRPASPSLALRPLVFRRWPTWLDRAF